MNGTVKAVVGCALTLLLLGGIVTYLETRLPSEVKRYCLEERALLSEATREVTALKQKVVTELKAHGDVLGDTAKSERWYELTALALEDLQRAEKDYAEIFSSKTRSSWTRLSCLVISSSLRRSSRSWARTAA